MADDSRRTSFAYTSSAQSGRPRVCFWKRRIVAATKIDRENWPNGPFDQATHADAILKAVVELADLTGAEVPTLRAIDALADLLNKQTSPPLRD